MSTRAGTIRAKRRLAVSLGGLLRERCLTGTVSGSLYSTMFSCSEGTSLDEAIRRALGPLR
jgi:hypothetical protein